MLICIEFNFKEGRDIMFTLIAGNVCLSVMFLQHFKILKPDHGVLCVM